MPEWLQPFEPAIATFQAAGTSLCKGLRLPCTVCYEMEFKARVLCKRSSMAPRSCPSQLLEGSSIMGTEDAHGNLKTWVDWSFSADVTRGAENFCKSIRGLVKRCLRSRRCRRFRSQPRFATSQSETKSYRLHRSWRQTMRLVSLCGQCARWQTARRPGRYTNAGHRDKTYGMAEISSTCAAPACRRSVLSAYLQLVGDQPAVSICIDRAEQLPPPLLLCF